MDSHVAQKKKLLIVEDDFYIRDIYTIQGKLMDFDIITAIDGEEAIEKIKSQMLDIVLLDLMLPKVDGMTVLKTVKSDPTFASLKFIVTTNLDDSNVRDEVKRLGAVEYLLKMNYTPRKVLEITKQYIN